MITTNEEITIFINTLKDISDYDFSGYSQKSFKRRVEKILEDYNINFKQLLQKVRTNRVFIEDIVKEITVNTTELFRNPKSWQAIKYRILPKLQELPHFNIWHAGCSTGQEIYSMLILLSELNMLDKARIYASDINSDVIETAKRGRYVYRFNIEYLENFDKVIRQNPYNFEQYNNVPYSKYMHIDKIKDSITMNDFLKNRVNFKKHNIVKLENIHNTKFDIIFCRNLLIYFNQNLQARVLNFFHQQLKNNAFLVLGYHESILGLQSQKFNKKGLFYTKKLI